MTVRFSQLIKINPLKKILIAISCVGVLACNSDPKPKPSAMLSLEYPKPQYKQTTLNVPFSFEQNSFSEPIQTIKTDEDNQSFGIDIRYPEVKGTIYLTYRRIDNNFTDLLRDAQNLTQKHTIKADEIAEVIYENPQHKVYGMFYEVGGNAASQSQFYVTDSVKHFLSGSLYFYAKPNYDSIYPAAVYLKNDIKHIMETVKWKE